MRISILTDWWAPEYVGGAERTLEEMALALVREGHLVQVVTFKNELRQNYSHYEKGVEVLRIRSLANRSWEDKKSFTKFREAIRVYIDFISPLLVVCKIRSLKPDVVIFGEIDRFGANLILTASILLRKTPIIRTYHDFSDACVYRSKFRNRKNCEAICGICKIKNLSFRVVSSKYFASVYVSEFLRSNLVVSKKVPIESTSVGYPNVFAEIKNSTLQTKQFDPRNQELLVGIVSRINITKDLETVLRALTLTQRRVRLYIVGDGDRQYLSSLKEFQSRNKLDVIFCGFQSNPFQYLESLGVRTVIVPAIWQEAFGRVPIEAAINGFHVIVSATGGLLESGMQLEPQAVFYSPGNAKDLSNILDVYKVPDQVTYLPPVNTFNSAINSALQKAKGIM